MKRAFTLVELLVAVVIIAILAAAVMGALHHARDSARAARTRFLIAKLDSAVASYWEGYMTRRVRFPDGKTVAEVAVDRGLDPNSTHDLARVRLDAIRDLMRMEMPDCRSDFLDPPVSGIPQPWRQRQMQDWYTAISPTPDYIEAEIFCYWLLTFAPEIREHIHDRDLADSDGDGAKEFVDGWGNPIAFLRWAPGLVGSDIQQPGTTVTGDGNHDPFDYRGIEPNAFRLFPLIYSAGPDGVYDIDVQPGHSFASLPVNPYAFPIGQPVDADNVSVTARGQADGSPGHLDNLTNHRAQP